MNEALTPSKDEKQNAMLCHLLALSGLVTGGLGAILGPIVMWILKKETSPFVDEHGKESVNFQITALVAGIVCFILGFVFIGIFLGLVLLVIWLVCVIKASLAANEGQSYRYPFCIRFLK